MILLLLLTNTSHSSQPFTPNYQNQSLGSSLSYPLPPRSPSPVPPYPPTSLAPSSSSPSFSSSSSYAPRQQSSSPHSSTPNSPTRVHRQPVLDSLFSNDKTFDDLKRTIANTIKNAVSTAPSPIPLTPTLTRSISPPLPTSSSSEKYSSSSPSRNSTTGFSSDGNFTEISTSTSSTSSTASGSQIKTVKTLVSKFTTQLQTAASSKNANEFIDLLARFSTEYASVMRNEETSSLPPIILSSSPSNFPHQQQHQQQQQQQINSPTQSSTPQIESPTLHKQFFFASEPTSYSPTPDIKAINSKSNESLQMIREMQDMAATLKAKAKNQNAERDNKIQRVSEDILTVLKAQYQADMQAVQEQSIAALQYAQEQHMIDLRSNIERYERRIHEMTIQNETTLQQYRERMLSGAGSSDEIRRENAQLRAQVGSLQAEIRTMEVKMTSAEEERKEKRRQDLMRGERGNNNNNNDDSLLLQIRQLENEIQQIRSARPTKEKEEWEGRMKAMKEAHVMEMERKEKEYLGKLQEVESMNKALRSSIQQMQQMHRKG